MKLACSKCKAQPHDQSKLVHRYEHGETYIFCPLCRGILDKQERQTGICRDFMVDHADFKMNEVQKLMLAARLKRSENKGAWVENT